MKRHYRTYQYGFTLIELLIYMAVSSALMGSMYQTFYAQQKSYIAQNHAAEMQQNLRSGMYVMTKDLRSVGYDPTKRASPGFVTAFPAPNDQFVINYATSTNIIAFTTDTNGSGTTDASNLERLAYRLNAANRTLERFNASNVLPGMDWEAVVDNVDAVNFVYLQHDGTLATLANQIRAVEIALLVRARHPDSKFINTTTYRNKRGTILCTACTGDHYHRRLLTTTVQARNLRDS